MGTTKRQRHKEAREQRLAAERAAARRTQRRRRFASAVLAAVVIFALMVVVAQQGGDDPAEPDAEATPTTAPAEEASVEPGQAEPAAFTYGSGECPPPEGAAEPQLSFDAAPTRCIEEGVDYRARVVTSRGEFTIDLFEDRAPGTVNNFVTLARWGYYQGDDFHRIIPDFVVQGGDPVGDPPGTGGPGYQIADELPAEGEYQIGSVAMANSGPDTNGSQFFVVTGERGVALPPQYSLFGQVTEGLEVVQVIGGTGSPEGTPLEPTTIEQVEIIEA